MHPAAVVKVLNSTTDKYLWVVNNFLKSSVLKELTFCCRKVLFIHFIKRCMFIYRKLVAVKFFSDCYNQIYSSLFVSSTSFGRRLSWLICHIYLWKMVNFVEIFSYQWVMWVWVALLNMTIWKPIMRVYVPLSLVKFHHTTAIGYGHPFNTDNIQNAQLYT